MTREEMERLASEIFDMLPDDPQEALQIMLWLTVSTVSWTVTHPELFVANFRNAVSVGIKETCQ